MIDERELDKTLKTLTAIWVAMLMSVPIYLFVVPRQLGEGIGTAFPPESFRMLRTALYIVSLATILGARLLSKHLLSGKLKLPQYPAAGRQTALQLYATAVITPLALCDSVAIHGLVLFIMGRDTMSLYLLGSISIVSMLTYRPVRQDMVDAAAKLEAGRRGTP